MSFKLGLLIFLYFVFVQNSSTLQIKDFQSLLGACPNKKGISNFELIEEINGKWYTHWTTGKFSPWNYLQCQSHEIFAKSENEPVEINSQFKIDLPLPYLPNPIEIKGQMEAAENGQFDLTYYNSIIGNFYEKFAILGGDLETGIIAWACLDYKIFHLETTMVMSKSKNLDKSLQEQLEAIMNKFGILNESVTQIDQKNCQ